MQIYEKKTENQKKPPAAGTRRNKQTNIYKLKTLTSSFERREGVEPSRNHRTSLSMDTDSDYPLRKVTLRKLLHDHALHLLLEETAPRRPESPGYGTHLAPVVGQSGEDLDV